jgi:hypothetical protein
MPHSPSTPASDRVTDAAPDHYRVLYVQPDAPVEVIQASWRTLMGRLRQHPDLGGSHERALLINAAWAVLGDPARRAAYDLQVVRRAGLLASRPGGAASASRADVAQPQPVAGAAWRAHCCALCQQAFAGALRPDSRCANCQSPLAALPGPGAQGHELLGRRSAVRRDQSHVALVHLGWPSAALPVRWRDLSLTGLSFYAPQAIAPGRRLRLIDSVIDGVIEVVGCRTQGRVFTVHGRLLTALLLQATGVFVSAQA